MNSLIKNIKPLFYCFFIIVALSCSSSGEEEAPPVERTANDVIEDFKKSEPLTFEGNPLEFILQKYPSLDATMIDLLTPSFRDYVTGIFIIAPKPTTFRILLHNNQEFHLVYSPQSYIAKISGKKYNLINKLSAGLPN